MEVMTLLFKPNLKKYSEEELADRIKKDIVSTLNRKGVSVRIANIDVQSGILNLQIYIGKKRLASKV